MQCLAIVVSTCLFSDALFRQWLIYTLSSSQFCYCSVKQLVVDQGVAIFETEGGFLLVDTKASIACAIIKGKGA